MLKAIVLSLFVLAPVPKDKPIEESEFVGVWKLFVAAQKGPIEFRVDGTFTTNLDGSLIYSGTWRYRNGHLQALGKVYTSDGKELCDGGFYVKFNKRFVGKTAEKFSFKLEKP